MLEEATTLLDLEVFTPWGVKVGDITNIEVDSESSEMSNIFIDETNPRLVEEGASIMIPYRWIQGLGDIIILKHFPHDIPIKVPDDYGLEDYY